MKTSMMRIKSLALALVYLLIAAVPPATADDTCTFTTSDVTPNIVIMLDSGSESENIAWHGGFNNGIDYTPKVATPRDVTLSARAGTLRLTDIKLGAKGEFIDSEQLLLTAVAKTVATADGVLFNTIGVPPTEGLLNFKDQVGALSVGDSIKGIDSGCTATVAAVIKSGNGFFNEIGYIMDGLTLRPTLNTLDADTNNGFASATATFNINGRSITLPIKPATTAVDGVIDNARLFRYSKNYLNWLFFHSTGTLELQSISGVFLENEPLTGSTGVEAKADGVLTGTSLNYYITEANLAALGNFKAGEKITGKFSGATAEVVTNTVNADRYSGDGRNLPNKTRFYYAKKAILDVTRVTVDPNNTRSLANFSVFNFVNTDGASLVQPLKGSLITTFVGADPNDNVLDPQWTNNLNNMKTSKNSPLAEGLATIGNYYGSAAIKQYIETYYCQKNFVLLVSPGIPSYDDRASGNSFTPSPFDSNHDGDAAYEGTLPSINSVTHAIPVNINSNTYLDDAAAYLHDNKVVYGGFQNLYTYSLGFMSSDASDKYLINTSNNGNGYKELYDPSHPEYGKYHFRADDADEISEKLKKAISAILSRTNTFTAPVVPVTRTTSGSDIYLAFFKPVEANFWEGDVAKYGIDLDTLQIIDAKGNPATYPNGALKEDAVPFWSTKNWAILDPGLLPVGTQPNGIHNTARNIYTYLGYNKALTSADNAFKATNTLLTERIMGYPNTGKDNVINYVRGGDVYDEDGDGSTTENRNVITGDVLHSEPAVFQYLYADGSSKTMVFFGSNDGMLHAVYDVATDTAGIETLHGTEAWAFIPPDQLQRLKAMLEDIGHQFYIDSSPKIYFDNVNIDDTVDPAEGDKVYLVCGLRKGGKSYFALDITDPMSPQFMWRVGYENSGTVIFSNIYQYDAGTVTDGYFQNGQPLVEYYTLPFGAARVKGTLKGSLAYDTPTGLGAFAVGDVVTGALSGARGTISAIDAVGGVLSFEDVRHKTGAGGIFGAFDDNENLLVGGTVIALANGVLTDIHLDYDNLTSPFSRNKWIRNMDPYTGTQPVAYGYIQSTVPLNPDTLIPELGESWSEPAFGWVLTSSPGDADYATDDGTLAFFVGGGFTADNSSGQAVLALNVATGKIIKMWSGSPTSSVNLQTSGMSFSVASSVRIVDEDNNGFVDKLYVGDLGGQMWRIGRFTDAAGAALTFPETDENINNWSAHILFAAGCAEGDGNCLDGVDDNGNGFVDEPRKFFYPPSITLEKGYDLVSMATGDRENACDPTTQDGIFAVKDDHTSNSYEPGDLVDVTDEALAPIPNLDGGGALGWYLLLDTGEKSQATGTVFFKTFYVTTFRPSMPSDPGYDPCLPGGEGRLYALAYKTGGSVLTFGEATPVRSKFIGGGIPSRPVMIIPPKGAPKLFISVGSTDETDPASGGEFGAGVVALNPLAPPINFFYLWWRELFD